MSGQITIVRIKNVQPVKSGDDLFFAIMCRTTYFDIGIDDDFDRHQDREFRITLKINPYESIVREDVESAILEHVTVTLFQEFFIRRMPEYHPDMFAEQTLEYEGMSINPPLAIEKAGVELVCDAIREARV